MTRGKDSMIDFFQNEIVKINESINLVNRIGNLPNGARYLLLSSLTIEVKNLEDLEMLKAFLDKKLGWKGKVVPPIWSSEGKIYASFKDDKYDFSVWLCMSPEDFPDNLIPGARVVELLPEVNRRFKYVQEEEK
ncbi:MAG: hypothetical protein J7K15_12160 [Deltaproteobacteria bacterium]|nr:hypothetical protein [Deltaproteobacteria bacterium]